MKKKVMMKNKGAKKQLKKFANLQPTEMSVLGAINEDQYRTNPLVTSIANQAAMLEEVEAEAPKVKRKVKSSSAKIAGVRIDPMKAFDPASPGGETTYPSKKVKYKK
jgi:hypothetical protein